MMSRESSDSDLPIMENPILIKTIQNQFPPNHRSNITEQQAISSVHQKKIISISKINSQDEDDELEDTTALQVEDEKSQDHHINKIRLLQVNLGYTPLGSARLSVKKGSSINKPENKEEILKDRASMFRRQHTHNVNMHGTRGNSISEKPQTNNIAQSIDSTKKPQNFQVTNPNSQIQSEIQNKEELININTAKKDTKQVEQLENTLMLSIVEDEKQQFQQFKETFVPTGKLDLIKEKYKFSKKLPMYPPQAQSQLQTLKTHKLFGFQSKQGSNGGGSSRIGSESQRASIVSKAYDIQKEIQQNPSNNQAQNLRRKKSLLHPNSQIPQNRANTGSMIGSMKPQTGKNYKQTQYKPDNLGLKQLTLQASSLFNISIDKITNAAVQESPSHLSNMNVGLFTPKHNDHQNASLNTTQQIAQIVQSVQPSERSNFQYTPKFFKPNAANNGGQQTMNHSHNNSQTNFALMPSDFHQLMKQQSQDSQPYYEIFDGKNRQNSSFERLEKEILDTNNQYRSPVKEYKESPCAMNQRLKNKLSTPKSAMSGGMTNFSQNATNYQTLITNSQNQYEKFNMSNNKKESIIERLSTNNAINNHKITNMNHYPY
ncbi:UNKNOWN [Stylonychia lemnae]|uniref:Uncharacterized protein n=1 Tax=Stylonychia lemnae TaxID=5949 RepID=A0A078B685_STYLE|nr:UNKNOWN [Stylonychia lemnae]|eukprot:CDW88822.1 UNKNOWN [Stylonychia lemnae]